MPHPGSVRCDSHRERRENRESLYDLFPLVRAARVVRGSWNSKGVSAGILTANCAKTANKKGSASGSLSSTLRKVCRKGSALNPGQQECFLSLPSYHRWLRKTCESLYWFASPCSRRSRCSRFIEFKRSVPSSPPCSCPSRCSRFKKFKGSVPCRFKAVQGRVQGEGFPSPPRWEPRAVKEEEALVRTLPVVRGSWNL